MVLVPQVVDAVARPRPGARRRRHRRRPADGRGDGARRPGRVDRLGLAAHPGGRHGTRRSPRTCSPPTSSDAIRSRVDDRQAGPPAAHQVDRGVGAPRRARARCRCRCRACSTARPRRASRRVHSKDFAGTPGRPDRRQHRPGAARPTVVLDMVEQWISDRRAPRATDGARRRPDRRGHDGRMASVTRRCSAGADQPGPLSSRPRRHARDRGRRRDDLPRQPLVVARRVPRRRGVLRDQRLPDHAAADRRGRAQRVTSTSKQFWIRRARRLLPALFVMLLGRRRLHRAVLQPRPGVDPRRPDRRALLRQQLVPDLGRRGLHRRRGVRAVAPPLVARRRGAVLPAVAADHGPHPAPRAAPAAARSGCG